MADEETAGNSGGLLASGKALLYSLVLILRTRMELAVTELEEERERVLAIFLYAVIAIFLLSFGLLLLTLFLVVFFWDTYRLEALSFFTALYLGGGLWAVLAIRRLLTERPRLLSATLEELKKDIQGLQG